MANTDITVFSQDGIFIPSVPSVPVVSGDTVSFTTSDGVPVVLFFSPEAASILSPAPSAAHTIPAGGKAVFTFSSSNAGAYSVYFGTDPGSGPAEFPTAALKVLLLELEAMGAPAPPFTGPHDTTTSGS